MSLREKFAVVAHDAWSGWMRHLLKSTTGEVPEGVVYGLVERWKRQMDTPYVDITDAEKMFYRKEADKYLNALASSPEGRVIAKALAWGQAKHGFTDVGVMYGKPDPVVPPVRKVLLEAEDALMEALREYLQDGQK